MTKENANIPVSLSQPSLQLVLASEKFQNTEAKLPLAIGMTSLNDVFITDLTEARHLFIAGSYCDKDECLNALLLSLLYKKRPSELKFVLVGSSQSQLSHYNKIGNQYMAVVPNQTDAVVDFSNALQTLLSLVAEMRNRLSLLSAASAKNIDEYNAGLTCSQINNHHQLPYIVAVIDGYIDLIERYGDVVEKLILHLAEMAHVVGIHLVIATWYYPSITEWVMSDAFKANFPTRITFRLALKGDSQSILDASAAQQLSCCGDMLYSNGSECMRVRCAYADRKDIENVYNFIGSQCSSDPYLLPDF